MSFILIFFENYVTWAVRLSNYSKSKWANVLGWAHMPL